MTTPLVRAAGLARQFGGRPPRRAVDGVSLDLVAGEIVGLVGPHGAGKTTLLRLLAGRLRPDRGEATVDGVPVRDPRARSLVGFAPDGPAFPPGLTVREVLEYYARLHGPASAVRGAVGAALEVGQLGDVAGRRVAALPRGLLHRLSLAQATLGARRVLLLDETLSGVDPVTRRAVCERLVELAWRGTAIVLSSDDLAAVERIAARVVVLVRGRVAREGAVAALLRGRVLEVVLDRPPPAPPAGFRLTPVGLETELGDWTVEAALAVCRAHRLAVRASRVRQRSLEELVIDAVEPRAR